MSKYLIDESELSVNDISFEKSLSEAHARKERPLCLCKLDGVEMYVAKLNDVYFLKRMPGTGMLHDFRCHSFEPPAELSGLGQVSGSAIKEEGDNDNTKIKIDFSLSRMDGRKAPVMGEGEKKPGDVTTDPNKLTMRALLHYLYDQSGLNRYEPVSKVKRNWFQIRKALMQSASNKLVNGNPLSELLFIPETFFLDRKEEIKANRKKAISGAVYKGTGKRNMMMVFGEVKVIEPDSFGYKIIIKHLADFKFRISDDLYKRLSNKYALEIELAGELQEDGHLLVMGTFFVDLKGYATMETCTLQIADENWIIFENGSEKYLMNVLNEYSRSYIKGMRYNLNSDTPFASLVLTDTEHPTAMYVTAENNSELYFHRRERLISESKYKSWVWEVEEEMPELPTIRAVE
ncbi:DUF1173 family protein [uncultured Flavobacterium sp.]|uniref:DUF1173 family protein n=1 Tax=uncultured Flavobacterium sp. TaxID=165435 RepID=UPI002596074C|nr:DUF1173 family protein [uncultured Flavobacterium sp.]